MCRHEKRMHSPELKGHIARKTGRMWLTFHRLHIPENSVCVLFFFLYISCSFCKFCFCPHALHQPTQLAEQKKKKQLLHQMEKKKESYFIFVGRKCFCGCKRRDPSKCPRLSPSGMRLFGKLATDSSKVISLWWKFEA